MLMVRPAAEADAAQIAAIYTPFVRDTHTSFEQEPPDAAEMARRIRETLRTHPWLVCERDREVLGYAYATPHRARAAYQWCTETTVYVKEGLRRSGVGRRLYGALFAVLEHQGFRMAYAAIALPNPASAGLHEALGFEPLGVYRAAGYKHGAWHDVGWWQRAVRSLDPNPTPPLPFASLTSDDLKPLLEAPTAS
jgi:phosphinothricin acetyltransferase